MSSSVVSLCYTFKINSSPFFPLLLILNFFVFVVVFVYLLQCCHTLVIHTHEYSMKNKNNLHQIGCLSQNLKCSFALLLSHEIYLLIGDRCRSPLFYRSYVHNHMNPSVFFSVSKFIVSMFFVLFTQIHSACACRDHMIRHTLCSWFNIEKHWWYVVAHWSCDSAMWCNSISCHFTHVLILFLFFRPHILGLYTF